VSSSLCTNIAEDLSNIYTRCHVDTAKTNNIVNSVCKYYETRSTGLNVVGDYINGASLSINPLPTYTALTFNKSDVAALYSDWMTTRSDLEAVWSAVSLIYDELAAVSDASEEAAGEANDRAAGRSGAAGQTSGTREADAAE
jgi:hypothetical protein